MLGDALRLCPMALLTPTPYQLDLVEDEPTLRQLYGIDEAAYDENSITFASFLRWWKSYDLGLKVVKLENRIIAALGLWGLDEDTTRRFLAGQILENDISPLPSSSLEVSPTSFWYCSGLVSMHQKAIDSPLRLLLRSGLAAWVGACHVRYPGHIYALGYSQDGIGILERLGFEVIREAGEMPDGCPLYWRQIKSVDEVRSLLFRSHRP
jgi:hypothetical protein